MFYFLETHKFIALGALTFICWLSVLNCEPKTFRHLFAQRISSAFNQIGPSSVEILLVKHCVSKLKQHKAGIYFSKDGLEQNYGLCSKIEPSRFVFLFIPKINNVWRVNSSTLYKWNWPTRLSVLTLTNNIYKKCVSISFFN